MGKVLAAAMMLAAGCSAMAYDPLSKSEGSARFYLNEGEHKDHAHRLSGNWSGAQPLRSFTIKGVTIEATDKRTAEKIFRLKHAGKKK